MEQLMVYRVVVLWVQHLAKSLVQQLGQRKDGELVDEKAAHYDLKSEVALDE